MTIYRQKKASVASLPRPCLITSREVYEARRPHTCSRQCVFAKKKTRKIGQFINNSGVYRKKKKDEHIFLAFSTPEAVSYHFFLVFPRRGALCNAATTGATYSWVSVVTMSAIKGYCRELSIEYSSLPKIGAVCEISSKEHEGSSSSQLKAP